MKFISHRGNIENKNISEENNPEKIQLCLSLGYDVEIDVWQINNEFFLGHDSPEYHIEEKFLHTNNLWCHAKNLNSLYSMLSLGINCFWHQNDDFTLTSKGIIWTFPNKKITKNSIIVMPECADYSPQQLQTAYGICSDNIKYYRSLLIGE